MRMKSVLSMAISALLMAACNNAEELAMEMGTVNGYLRATVESNSPSTRVGFDANGKFYWTENDKLGVTTTEENTEFKVMTLQEGMGEATGDFQGSFNQAEEIQGYAVYPYYENESKHSINGNTLTYNFQKTYEYSKVDADFFTEVQGTGNSFNPAMWGKIVDKSVALKHLGGVFCIKISSMPIASGTLTLTTDKKINGGYEVALPSDNSAPVITAVATEVDSEKSVSITFTGATQNKPGVFYIPVPTTATDEKYNNVTISLTADNTTTYTASAGDITMNRRSLRIIMLNALTTSVAENKEAAQTQLGAKGDVSVSLEAEVAAEAENVIEIPAVAETEEVPTKTLSLQAVESGASLTIKETTQDAGQEPTTEPEKTTATQNFTLSIPQNETTDAGTTFEPLSVEVNMPNSTVTLTGNLGTANYGTITATTAENTLIVSSGVEVEKIIVNKGNVRVCKEAKVTTIERGSGNTAKVVVYKEPGAVIENETSLNTEQFLIVEVYNTPGIDVYTAEELKEVLTASTDAGSGDVVVNIMNNIDLTGKSDWGPITVDGYNGAGVITLNGNGFALKGMSKPLFKGGFAGTSGIIIKNLSIVGSTIVSENTLGSGAFIETIDSMEKIELDNCHLLNSSVTGSRTGGLIGWTAGYNIENNGPVKTYVTITNCSAINCTITGAGTVGGINGHAGANAWTFTTITDCTVKNCNLISNDDSWRVGVVLGTANVGEVTISGITQSGNTLKQDNSGTEIVAPYGNEDPKRVLYGRFVPDATGKLTIDGVSIN